MSIEAAGMAVSYPWQCLECKTCSVCQDPGGEEEMVFCDHCDRGYHSFCLDMKGIPEGRWLCIECCSCASCGSERGRGDRTQWNHETVGVTARVPHTHSVPYEISATGAGSNEWYYRGNELWHNQSSTEFPNIPPLNDLSFCIKIGLLILPTPPLHR